MIYNRHTYILTVEYSWNYGISGMFLKASLRDTIEYKSVRSKHLRKSFSRQEAIIETMLRQRLDNARRIITKCTEHNLRQ